MNRARLHDALPTLLVLVAALAYGLLGHAHCLVDPVRLAPDTRFTSAHLLAINLANANLLLGHPFATSTPLLGWPDVADFRPLMWPMLMGGWFLPPVVAYTLTGILLPLFNAAAGSWFGRVLGLDRYGQAAAGGLLAFHPWVRETLTNGQVEQAGLGGIALVWGLAWRAREGRRGALLGLGPVLLGFALAAPHLGVVATLGVGLMALPDLLRPRAGAASVSALVLLVALAAAGLAGVYHSANFTAKTQVYWPKGSSGHAASLSSLPEAASFGRLLLPPHGVDADTNTLHPMYLGWILLVAALLALRRRPDRLGLVALGFAVLAFGDRLGPIPGPFAILSLVSPTIAQSQSPYRMLTGLLVILVVLASRWVHTPRALLLGLGLTGLEGAAVCTRPWPLPAADFHTDPVYRPFRDHSGPILDLPPLFGTRCGNLNYHVAIEAARRLRPSPILPAAPAFYPAVNQLGRRVLEAWQARPCGPALASLVHEIGFTGVVLHRGEPGCPVQPSFERCLIEAFGPGQVTPEMRWWDPLPLPADAPPRVRP